MTQAEAQTSEAVADSAADEALTHDSPWLLEANVEDFTLVESGDVDVFLVDLTHIAGIPPYYIAVGERQFALQRDTFTVRGHGAELPGFVRAEEADGRLVLLGERGDRYLVYIHDPTAEDEDEEDGGE